MDEFDNINIPSDESENELHAEGSSRRAFLKAAVVGSAAAVAVSGAGAATLALTGHRGSSLSRLVVLDSISGVTGDACTTDTATQPTEKTTFGNDSIDMWDKFNGVPAGTYTVHVTPSIPTTNVDYQSKGNNVFVYNLPGGADFTCHPADRSTLPTELKNSGSYDVTFTTPSDGDVLVLTHLQGISAGSVSLTVDLYQGTGTGGTLVDHLTANFTIS